MSIKPLLKKEACAMLGDQIYEKKLKSIEKNHQGKFVAIDVQSGDFEIDTKEINATDRLLTRHPDSQIWLTRIGSRFTRHFVPRCNESIGLYDCQKRYRKGVLV